MSVYVDRLRQTPLYWLRKAFGWRYKTYCHLFADSDGELFDFATTKLGLSMEWLQGTVGGNPPHYDLTENKRVLAIKFGAVNLSDEKLVQFIKQRRALHDHTS